MNVTDGLRCQMQSDEVDQLRNVEIIYEGVSEKFILRDRLMVVLGCAPGNTAVLNEGGQRFRRSGNGWE